MKYSWTQTSRGLYDIVYSYAPFILSISQWLFQTFSSPLESPTSSLISSLRANGLLVNLPEKNWSNWRDFHTFFPPPPPIICTIICIIYTSMICSPCPPYPHKTLVHQPCAIEHILVGLLGTPFQQFYPPSPLLSHYFSLSTIHFSHPVILPPYYHQHHRFFFCFERSSCMDLSLLATSSPSSHFLLKQP